MRVLIFNQDVEILQVFVINDFVWFPLENCLYLYPLVGSGEYHFKLMNVSRTDYISICYDLVKNGFSILTRWPAVPVMEGINDAGNS